MGQGLQFWTEGRGPLVSQAKGETRWSLKPTCQLLVCVLQPSHYFTKRVPHHRRKIYADSLWLYSYYTQSFPSKNKNIDYIFIYLWVFRYLSSGQIYDTMKGYSIFPRAPLTGASPSDVISRTLAGGVLPLCREAVSVFYSRSWQGCFFFCNDIKNLMIKLLNF